MYKRKKDNAMNSAYNETVNTRRQVLVFFIYRIYSYGMTVSG